MKRGKRREVRGKKKNMKKRITLWLLATFFLANVSLAERSSRKIAYFFLFNRKRIASLALKSRLPSMHGTREYVEAGGLMSYGADQTDSYRRVAYYVDRILKGAKPADLPVEQPTKFEFVINLKTAKQIGVTIPPDLLARATKIIR